MGPNSVVGCSRDATCSLQPAGRLYASPPGPAGGHRQVAGFAAAYSGPRWGYFGCKAVDVSKIEYKWNITYSRTIIQTKNNELL